MTNEKSEQGGLVRPHMRRHTNLLDTDELLKVAIAMLDETLQREGGCWSGPRRNPWPRRNSS